MTQTGLDQVLESLASTRDDLDARRDVLERIAHLLLHRNALGGQVIARICATAEADPALEDLGDLLGAALSAARMARESGQKRGDALVGAIEDAVDLAAGQGRLESFHRLQLARSWAQNGLSAPVTLELSEMAEDAIGRDPPDPEMLEDMLRNLVTQAQGDALTLHSALTEMFPAMPAALREAVVEFAIARPDPIFAQLGCYWLVDPSATIRRAAMRGLATRLENGNLSAETTARLTVLRSWMPRDDVHVQVDQLLRDALRAGVGQAAPDGDWKVQSALASLPDGSGAQSMAIALRSGKARAVAMILLKTDYGVKDAYVIPCDSAREQTILLDRITEETGALSVPMEYVASAVALALGDGLAHGLPPSPGLIDVAEMTGLLSALRPDPGDTTALLTGLSVHADVSALSARKRGRLINASKDWWGLHELLRYWHDESDDARQVIEAARGPGGEERALWTWLETRRGWWAHQIARSAALLDAIGDPDTESFAATAMALLDGRALKKIPIMENIHEQTMAAWVLDDADLPLDAGLGDLIELAEQEEPALEGDGELDTLLDAADVTADWIDGYLMSVVIAPKMIAPNRWLPQIVDNAVGGLGPAELQRFLDIVMMRANAAIAAVDGQNDFEAEMHQRGADGIRDWAAGFNLGRESFKSSWPKRSTGQTDHAILRQLAEAANSGLSAPEIRIIGTWLSARHAANMQDI